MTFKEKLEKEHPGEDISELLKKTCPNDTGKGCPKECDGSIMSCNDCWNREIPEVDDATMEAVVEDLKNPVTQEEIDAIAADHVQEPIILSRDEKTKFIEIVEKAMSDSPKILDSGNRRQFESGAVRDIQEGKGRCDLLPLDVVADFLNRDTKEYILYCINRFQNRPDELEPLFQALHTFAYDNFKNEETMILEVSKHFEEGAKKYGENNWQKGIPVHCYIDSAVRHYLKFLRGDKDEPHDRAFCWNIMCAIWTCKHKPELNEYRKEN